jgi:hypothetical protein
MTNIKMIATDLDGTLLDDRKRVPEENIAALREAAESGILVALASGRMLSNVERTEAQIGLDCILIAYNGAKVAGPRSDGRPLLVHRPLPADVAEVFVEYSHSTGLLLNFYDREILFAEDGTSRRGFMDLYTRRTGVEYQIVDNLLHDLPGVSPTKLILLADPQETLKIVEQLRETLGDRACITLSEPEYVEITAPGVDKGAILGPVASHYGVSLEEVMALGDADNDVTMLRAAGIGVALANAPARVRASAHRVTDRTNNEAGVAEAIRRWALCRSEEYVK